MTLAIPRRRILTPWANPLAFLTAGKEQVGSDGKLRRRTDGKYAENTATNTSCCCSACGCSRSITQCTVTFSGLTYAAGCQYCPTTSPNGLLIGSTLGTYTMSSSVVGAGCQFNASVPNFYTQYQFSTCTGTSSLQSASVQVNLNQPTAGQVQVLAFLFFNAGLFSATVSIDSACDNFVVSNGFTGLQCPASGSVVFAFGGTATVTFS